MKRPLPKHATRPNRTIRFLPGRIEVRMTIREPSVEAIVAAFRKAQRDTVEMQVHNDELEVRQLVRERRATIGTAPGRDFRSVAEWLGATGAPKLPAKLRQRGRKPRVAA
jgi:hypothetical protein